MLVGLLPLGGCGNKKEVETARKSVYDTDFAVVYSAALAATRDLYPSTDDMPGAGAIRTSWHQVQFANNQDDLSNNRTMQNGTVGGMQGSTPAAQAGGMPTRLAYKRFFIRFDVSVVGGRPWRVKVAGHASEWDPGAAMPVELLGVAKPAWLEGRTDALTLAIYQRIKKHAIPMQESAPIEKAAPLPKTDPGVFTAVPLAADKRLGTIKDLVNRRDYTGLRALVADDVHFSPGAEPSADIAFALWQADPEPLEAMSRLIGPACATTSDTTVMCPAGMPLPGTYRLVLELRGTEWLVTTFLKTE